MPGTWSSEHYHDLRDIPDLDVMDRAERELIKNEVIQGMPKEELLKKHEKKKIIYALKEVIFTQVVKQLVTRHYQNGESLNTQRDLQDDQGSPNFHEIEAYLKEVIRNEAVGVMNNLLAMPPDHSRIVNMLMEITEKKEPVDLVISVDLGIENIVAAGVTLYSDTEVPRAELAEYMEHSLATLYLLAAQNIQGVGDPKLMDQYGLVHSDPNDQNSPRKLSPEYFAIDRERKAIVLRTTMNEIEIEGEKYPEGTPLLFLVIDTHTFGQPYIQRENDYSKLDPILRCVGMTSQFALPSEEKIPFPFSKSKVDVIALVAALMVEILKQEKK